MKTDFKKLVERLHYWWDQDKKVDKALADFSKAISPSNYPLFMERSSLTGFLDRIEFHNKRLADDLSYYVYERGKITVGGKEYDCSKKTEFIKYLQDEYSD